MDVELQVLKHLARDAQSTTRVIDEYCAKYTDISKEVKSYECFKYLHLGIIAPIKRKSLPEVCKVVAIKSAHSWHHFITKSPGSSTELKEKRFPKIFKELKRKTITLVIDETEYRKKGKKTDYLARKYLGSVGKVDKGIVSVNAYGIYESRSFLLSFQMFKPKETLKPSEQYKTKIDWAGENITELIDYGFQI